MVRLETGDTGVAVTADSDGALYSGIFGIDNYVVATGNKFKAEIQSNNKIKISDGSAIMNGRHVRIPSGDSNLVTINNGSQGMNRIDIIVLRYKKELTGMESGNLEVIQGEESSSEPKVPDCTKGDILTGATQADFPLYEVKLEGINITDIKPLFQTIGNITELEKQVSELNGNLKKLIIKKNYSNRINVTAGQRSTSFIAINAIDGYTAIVADVYSSHATTITSDVRIASNRVNFYFDAKSANSPETFDASVIYVRNDIL